MESMQDAQSIPLNGQQLRQLIVHLHTLTGVWTNVLDSSGRDLHLRMAENEFCTALQSTEEGKQRCAACYLQAVRMCGNSGSHGLCACRCHAGLWTYLLPMGQKEPPTAYLLFGQLLDDSSRTQQWNHTLETLCWYPGDPEELRQKFLRLRQYSTQEVRAFAGVLQILASYLPLDAVLSPRVYSDAQRLEQYLDQHYMEALSLHRISADLHIGTTKLCALAKKISGGKTIIQLVSKRRVDAAKKLLITTGRSISEVAEQVGYSDYNYFTRIFRANTGMTPRAYRKSFEK